jgi:hypothetical protein
MEWGVVKTTYRLSAHFRVEIFPQIKLLTLYVNAIFPQNKLLTLYVNALTPLACYQQAGRVGQAGRVNV